MRIHLFHNPGRLRDRRANHLDLGPHRDVELGPSGVAVTLEAVISLAPGELALLTVHPSAARLGVIAPAGPIVFGEPDEVVGLSMVLGAREPLTVRIGEPLVRLALFEAPTVGLRHDPTLLDDIGETLPAGLMATLLDDAWGLVLGGTSVDAESRPGEPLLSEDEKRLREG